MNYSFILATFGLAGLSLLAVLETEGRRKRISRYWNQKTGRIDKNPRELRHNATAKWAGVITQWTGQTFGLYYFAFDPHLREEVFMAVLIAVPSVVAGLVMYVLSYAAMQDSRPELSPEGLSVRDRQMYQPMPPMNVDGAKGTGREESAFDQGDLFDYQDPTPRAYRD